MIASAPKLSQSLPADEPISLEVDFYDASLRSQMEAHYSGQYIAIHPETRDYVVERRPGAAFRALRSKQSSGSIIVHHIGLADPGLAARLHGEQPR